MESMFKRLGCIAVALFMMLFLGICHVQAGSGMDPEAQKLYDQWIEVMGYTAAGLIEKWGDPAPEIKPGLVITPENYKEYPGIKKLLPETVYRRLDPNFFLPIQKIEITETKGRFYPQPVIDGSRDCLETCKVNPETLALEGWIYGVPFPFDTDDPLEIIWNQNITSVSMDENASFDPLAATTYSGKRKIDSSWKAILGRYRAMGRQFSDIGKNRVSKWYEGSGIFEMGTLVLTYPADLKGMAFIRTRYWDVDKQDYIVSYLPGLKRLRVMSGTDAQDPMVGCEASWDMWGLEWQKQPSRTIFPNKYKILGRKVILSPTYPSFPALDIQGEQFFIEWEKRPVVILEIVCQDLTYTNRRRVLFMDLEHFRVCYEEYYDRKLELWKTWQDFKFLRSDGLCAWEGSDILNHISQRHTVLNMNAIPNAKMTPDQFDMRWLLRMAR
jgi:hypothetical protein